MKKENDAIVDEEAALEEPISPGSGRVVGKMHVAPFEEDEELEGDDGQNQAEDGMLFNELAVEVSVGLEVIF